MDSYIKRKVTCPCCNNVFEANILKGFYSNGNMGLDHNPHSPAIFDTIILCPHCGYVGYCFLPMLSLIDGVAFCDPTILSQSST